MYGFFLLAEKCLDMETVRKGLRTDELEKDTYQRLLCTACEIAVDIENPDDEVFSIRTCPECGQQWKQLS